MKTEESQYPLIREAATRILASGGQCSSELVARACGLSMADTPMVFRALRKDETLMIDTSKVGMYRSFKIKPLAPPKD